MWMRCCWSLRPGQHGLDPGRPNRQGLSGRRRDLESMFGYDTSVSVEELQETYEYNETCQRTVPEAFRCFYEATDFEDAIRNSISIGGDSDTVAAIAGSMAEAKWGVPDVIREEALRRLDKPLLDKYRTFMRKHAKDV